MKWSLRPGPAVTLEVQVILLTLDARVDRRIFLEDIAPWGIFGVGYSASFDLTKTVASSSPILSISYVFRLVHVHLTTL